MPVKSLIESKVDVGNMNEQKILELALKNKSKKSPFTFTDMLLQLNDEEMDKMWAHLYQMIMKQYESISQNTNKSPKKLQEISRVFQAILDLANVMLMENMPLPIEFLHLVVFLNEIILNLPSYLENLKNNISSVCETMHSMNYVVLSDFLVTNALIYLLKRSTSPKAVKNDIKRIYALRSVIPKILSLKSVDSSEVWELLKKCYASHLYPSSALEGQKILSVALILDVNHMKDIHNVIKKRLPSCSVAHATFFGKVYYDAWSHVVKTESLGLKEAIEIGCLADLILLAVKKTRRSVVLTIVKVLAQFHCRKKEIDGSLQMLYSLYHPVLLQYLKHPNGLFRANAAQLFLAVFPLEDEPSDRVMSDQELNGQMLLIQDLLLDDIPIVRCKTIEGLCLCMTVHWELFPEDMRETYLKILMQYLYHDSSPDVRCAIAKGFKGLLENPLTGPTLQNILPELKNMIVSKSRSIRAKEPSLKEIFQKGSITEFEFYCLEGKLRQKFEPSLILKPVSG